MIKIFGLKLYTEHDVNEYRDKLIDKIESRSLIDNTLDGLTKEFKDGLRMAYFNSCNIISLNGINRDKK